MLVGWFIFWGALRSDGRTEIRFARRLHDLQVSAGLTKAQDCAGEGASDSKYRLLEGQAPVNTEEIFAGRLTKSNEQLDRDMANHGGIRLTEPIKYVVLRGHTTKVTLCDE